MKPSLLYQTFRSEFDRSLTAPEKASFLIETALNMLGIQGDDRATVEAAIPIATQAGQLMVQDEAVFLQLAQYWHEIAPAAGIVFAAIKKQQG